MPPGMKNLTNSNTPKMDTQTILILIVIGLAAGMLGGLVGVGGGIIIVPALVYILGYSQKLAQGTSLGMLLLPVGILGAMQFHKHGFIDFKAVLIIGAGFVAGSFFGSKIALSLPQEMVKKIFAVIMLLIAIKMLFIDKPTSEKETQSSSIANDKTLFP